MARVSRKGLVRKQGIKLRKPKPWWLGRKGQPRTADQYVLLPVPPHHTVLLCAGTQDALAAGGSAWRVPVTCRAQRKMLAGSRTGRGDKRRRRGKLMNKEKSN